MVPILGATLALVVYVAAFMSFRLANPDLPVVPWDTTAWWFPGIEFIRASLSRGELPLWNPHQLVGTPFSAIFWGSYYPLLLPFVALPAKIAMPAHVAFHLLLAGVLTLLFGRRVGLSTLGALAAAVVFIGSAQLTGMANLLGASLSTFSWLPGVLLVIHRLVGSPRLGNGLLFSAVLSLLFLTGFMQATVYIVQVGGLYALYLLWQEPWAKRAEVLAFLLGFGLLALGIVSIQLFPTFELAMSGSRDLAGLSLEQASGERISGARIWLGLTGRGISWVALPALVVPLGLAAFARAEFRKQAAFFAAIFVLTLDFMRGTDGFVYPAYFELPLGNLFRNPPRIGFVMEFCAAMLIGLGISSLASWEIQRQRALMAGLLVLTACIAADVYLRNPNSFRYDALAAPDSLFQPSRLVEFADRSPLDRMFVVGEHVPLKFGQIHGYFTVTDYEPILPGRYKRFFGIPSDTLWHSQLQVVQAQQATMGGLGSSAMQDPRLLDLLSVKYYVDARYPRTLLLERGEKRAPGSRKISRASAEFGGNALVRAVEGRGVMGGFPTVYERASALPRTYLVHEARRAESEAQALEWVRSLDFDPQQTAIVTEEIALAPLKLDASETAVIAQYEAQLVTVAADCASDCLLVLTDLYDEGWRVIVDELDVPLLQVNYLFRGVELAAGQHRIRFIYDPASFRYGRMLSCGSLGIFLVLSLVHRLRLRAGIVSGAHAPDQP